MQAVRNFFGRGNDSEPSESVLAEWNKYTTEEANEGGQYQKDRLLASAEEGAATVSKLLGSSFKAVSAGVTMGVTGAAASVSSGVQSISLPSGMQLAYFSAVLGAGIVLLFLAFFLFLPVLILAPSKFAITFSIGSALVLASVSALRGWKEQLQHMISKERLPFTAAYTGSLLGTIYAAMFLHSYFFSLICCGVQVAALLYYVLSYFPGGAAGAQFMMGMAGKAFNQAFGACFGAFVK